MTPIFKQILIELEKRNKTAPFIIAIDGFGGAGKTTFAKKLQQYLTPYYNVKLFHLDNAIEPAARRYGTGYEEWFEYYYLQWDIKEISNQFFTRVKECERKVFFPFYDEGKDRTMMQSYSIDSFDIILIEGVFIQREEWRPFIDYSIFLHVPKDVRQIRLMERDNGSKDLLLKYQRRYWRAEDYYWTTEKPLEGSSQVVLEN